MNNWSNAIILSIILVAGVGLLVINSSKPTPVVPAPVVPGPMPVAEQGNPVQLYRDVRSLVQFAGQVQKAIEAAGREVAKADLRAADTHAAPVAQWTPPERQVVLYFYDDATPHRYAAQLIQQGHTVYRAGLHRQDLRAQFKPDRIPLWLVIRDGNVIYRSMSPPRFPNAAPVQQAPVYQQGPVYQSAPVYRYDCAGGTCQ